MKFLAAIENIKGKFKRKAKISHKTTLKAEIPNEDNGKKKLPSIDVAWIALVVSLVALLFQTLDYFNSNNEKIAINAFATPDFQNTYIQKVEPYKEMDDMQYALMKIEEFLKNEKWYSYIDVKVPLHIRATIYNNSNFPVAISQTNLYSTVDKKEIDLITYYENYYFKNGQIRAISDLENTKLANASGVHDQHFMSFGFEDYEVNWVDYVMNPSEINTQRIITSLQLNDEIRTYIIRYIQQRDIDFSDSEIDLYSENNVINRKFSEVVNEAVKDYFYSKNQEIAYTYMLNTSRGDIFSTKVIIFRP